MKNSKTKGLLGLLILLVAVVGFGFLGYKTVGDVKLGLDLAGGVSITYQAVEDNPSSEEMSDTIYKLQQRVQNYSTEAEVLPGGQQSNQHRYSGCERCKCHSGRTRKAGFPDLYR